MPHISWNEIQDRAVDKLYQPKPFTNDPERVALLFALYQDKTTGK